MSLQSHHSLKLCNSKPLSRDNSKQSLHVLADVLDVCDTSLVWPGWLVHCVMVTCIAPHQNQSVITAAASLKYIWQAGREYSATIEYCSTVNFLCNDCLIYQEICPDIKLSLLRGTTAVRMQPLVTNGVVLTSSKFYIECPCKDLVKRVFCV